MVHRNGSESSYVPVHKHGEGMVGFLRAINVSSRVEAIGEEKRHNKALKLGQASALPALRIRFAHCSASQSTLLPAG